MKRALIIVDIQNDYFPGGKMELVGIENAANNARHALELFRAKNLPIFHIQHLSNRAGATFFLPETDGVEIHECVTPQMGEYIIKKHFPNSFRETSLKEQLQRLNVEEIIICGAMTSVSIPTGRSSSTGSRYNSMASLMLTMASSRLSPSEMQPGRAGT